MDEYKELFYSRINHKLGNYGDVSARKELRHGLECRLVCRAETEKYIGHHQPTTTCGASSQADLSQIYCLIVGILRFL